MHSMKQIRAVGVLFAREEITEQDLRKKLEEIYLTNSKYLPQHGMAFKAGLEEANCDPERKERAWEIIEEIDSNYRNFGTFPGF